MLRFLIALAVSMLIIVPVEAEPPAKASDKGGHWLKPLDPLTPFRSSNDPSCDENSRLTPEVFRRICKHQSDELFWFILRDGLSGVMYRFALAVDYGPETVAGSDPFADSERPDKHILRVSWDFVDGVFQANHLLDIEDDFSKSLKLLGKLMTEEVGYPLIPVSPRLSPEICFGYADTSGSWSYGEGCVPERGLLHGTFRSFQRLCLRLSHPDQVDPFADSELRDILKPIESITLKAVTARETSP